MNRKLHRRRAVCRAALGLVLCLPVRAWAQAPCSPEAGRDVAQAWQLYRADSVTAAEAKFRQADRSCPGNLDAKVGLGFTALRLGHPARADSLFQLVLRGDSTNADGWSGLSLAAFRLGDSATAVRAGRRAVALNPGEESARLVLDRLSPGWDRPARAGWRRPDTLIVAARTRGEGFEVPVSNGWQPFYIKGINLGVALPGRFPAEFPTDSALYAGWLDSIAGMNANAVRLYTILPPEFYRALAGWNRTHPDRLLWLVHGVWTELPPEHAFNDPEWKNGFRQEMRRVVDLVHGRADLPVRPGHAGGRYDADVSRWTLAYIIGREWEPFAVEAYDSVNPGSRPFRGRYLETASAPAADVWMAEQCDYLLAYEADAYNAIRPIAYTNWPTLDPLHHPTETTIAEEVEWRKKFGRPAEMLREYDNDAIGLDAMLIHPTPANPAGWFASYHAYPYYPDFLLYDPGYASAVSPEGPSNYFGYLQDLRRHYPGIPLVIAEYGVPSSRGVAHLQPQGWNHGGHDERAMAEIDARLTREIRESGAAGGILFAWIDEWFKKNWIVVDFEIPAENTRQWHNVMDAEQNYGILGMYAGPRDSTPHLGGDPALWRTGTRVAGKPVSGPLDPAWLRVRSDESYVYLSASFPGLEGRPFPWDSAGIMIPIDTWLERKGQHRLPNDLAGSEVGFEFLVDLRGPADGEIRILPEYNPYGGPPGPSGDDLGRFYHRPITIVDREDGRFDSLYVTTNRARYTRDGGFIRARGVNRGRLRYGTESSSTLSDWYFDPASGLLQIRLAWGLLNVSDPSTRTLLFERAPGPSFGTVTADGFRFGLVTWTRGSRPRLAGSLPAVDSNRRWQAAGFTPWRWQPWTTPEWHERLKPAYEAMKATWAED